MPPASAASIPLGVIKWHSQRILLSHNLAGELIGVTPREGDRLQLRYAQLQLGIFDLHSRRFALDLTWMTD